MMTKNKKASRIINTRIMLKIILCAWIFAFAIFFGSKANAETTKSKRVLEFNPTKAVTSKEAIVSSVLNQPIIDSTKETRDERQASKAIKAAKASKLKAQVSAKQFFYDFSIYEGFAQLFDDFDGDGYYQTFSVTFDADILSADPQAEALVYGEIYLSQNGGPWELFHVTEDFIIFSDSPEDAWEVLSNLETGYVPDTYDVLIDLYEVGFSGIVATYSSNDTDRLYALPLESNEYDEVYIHDHDDDGGSMPLSLLIALATIMAYRFRNQK
ncbi:choice-of-anchor H family protein [Thalassotalea euphylliae]|uniref:choice-of-anchor H family protein n=1 Tax=Thalassotalea euphylliae TaxID=1655234 RepID=UPI003642E0B9